MLLGLLGGGRTRPRTPNLLGLGVEKCGTTFLNAAFESCPEILTPLNKELFFFNEHYDRGMDWYLSRFPRREKKNARWICDITPSYFRSERSLRRIKEELGSPKIIMVLRHPVYRAFSHYVHRLRHVAPKLECYEWSFMEELQHVGIRSLLFPQYGMHMQQLLDFFPREDILLLTYEQDIVDPASAQAKLAEFLDLPGLDFSALGKRRVNDGRMPRFYYSQDGDEVISIDSKRYQLPPGTLLLAHAKGTQAWPEVDPKTALANVKASHKWTRQLDTDMITAVFETRFDEDLNLLQKNFDIDVQRWRRETRAIAYEDALPEIKYLRALP